MEFYSQPQSKNHHLFQITLPNQELIKVKFLGGKFPTVLAHLNLLFIISKVNFAVDPSVSHLGWDEKGKAERKHNNL